MGWNYVFLMNLISAVGISVVYLTHNDVPWYLTAILCLNIMLLAVSSLMNDMKDRKRDERIEEFEKELAELRGKQEETNV